MSVSTKFIERLKSEQIFIELHADRYDDSDYCFIIDYDDDFLVIERFKAEGGYEGISVLLRQNISRIKWGGNELTSISKLIDVSKRQQSKSEVDLTSIETVLSTTYAMFGHISVFIQDIDKNICFVGQIHEIDNEAIVINEFGTKGTLDRRFILLSLEDITRIDAGGLYERNLEKLFLHPKNKKQSTKKKVLEK
jgi:hypothetical protein